MSYWNSNNPTRNHWIGFWWRLAVNCSQDTLRLLPSSVEHPLDAPVFSSLNVCLLFFETLNQAKHELWAEFNFKRRLNLRDTASPPLAHCSFTVGDLQGASLILIDGAINYIRASIRQNSVSVWLRCRRICFLRLRLIFPFNLLTAFTCCMAPSLVAPRHKLPPRCWLHCLFDLYRP